MALIGDLVIGVSADTKAFAKAMNVNVRTLDQFAAAAKKTQGSAASIGGGDEKGGASSAAVTEAMMQGEIMRQAFPGLEAGWRGPDTVLRGRLADQAALYGVLAQIEALGLELLEVRRLSP